MGGVTSAKPGRALSWGKRDMVSMDSTWTKLCTYTTVKKCSIVDAKIAISHKAVTLAIVSYIIWNLIVSHGYMKQEQPSAVVNAYVDQAGYYAAAASLKNAPPAYCDNPDTDFDYGGGWVYENNQCDFDLRLGDVLTKTEQAVFITTYFQDEPVDAFTASAAGLSAGNYFVPGVDQMRLVWDHQVSTSWGSTVSNPAIAFRRLGDAVGDSPRLTVDKDTDTGMTISDLLELAGVGLDAVNTPAAAAESAEGPTFRLSGTHVKINLEYSNMRREDPSDTTVKAKADVSYTKDGAWTSLGPKMIWKKDAAGVLHRFQRYHYVLRVSFMLSGTIGVFDFFTLFLNLAVATGLLKVAVSVVDAASEILVANFDDQKYDDRNDFMTLESLKEYALEQGILDRYATRTGMTLLDDDVMQSIRQRAARVQGNWNKPERGKEPGGGALQRVANARNKVASNSLESPTE
mmetsp:Transcript_3867/g.14259  ORF Transcript_3867/g.14259 Transcript_3867/m.14259 type:complete len:460 (-) Transcript_3867:805-2184(-)